MYIQTLVSTFRAEKEASDTEPFKGWSSACIYILIICLLSVHTVVSKTNAFRFTLDDNHVPGTQIALYVRQWMPVSGTVLRPDICGVGRTRVLFAGKEGTEVSGVCDLVSGTGEGRGVGVDASSPIFGVALDFSSCLLLALGFCAMIASARKRYKSGSSFSGTSCSPTRLGCGVNLPLAPSPFI